MATRNLNKVLLIGNLTRDPELRYTAQGTAVCTFGLATNRSWITDSGDLREDVEFHRIVAWNKLAELCSQLLSKGRKVYVEGRLQTRTWTGQDGAQRTTTEIVISEMIILDSRKYPSLESEKEPKISSTAGVSKSGFQVDTKGKKGGQGDKKSIGEEKSKEEGEKERESSPKDNKTQEKRTEIGKEDVPPEDIPF